MTRWNEAETHSDARILHYTVSGGRRDTESRAVHLFRAPYGLRRNRGCSCAVLLTCDNMKMNRAENRELEEHNRFD